MSWIPVIHHYVLLVNVASLKHCIYKVDKRCLFQFNFKKRVYETHSGVLQYITMSF